MTGAIETKEPEAVAPITAELSPREYDAIVTAITAVGASMDESASGQDVSKAIRTAKIALTRLGAEHALELMLRLSGKAQTAWGDDGGARVTRAAGSGPRIGPPPTIGGGYVQ